MKLCRKLNCEQSSQSVLHSDCQSFATSWLDLVRQRGSHIRLQKHIGDEVLKITVPAHRPVKSSTLSRILKQARLDVDQFLELL